MFNVQLFRRRQSLVAENAIYTANRRRRDEIRQTEGTAMQNNQLDPSSRFGRTPIDL